MPLEFEDSRPLPPPRLVADRPEVAKLVAEIERHRVELDAARQEQDRLIRGAAGAEAADTEALAAALRSGKKPPAGQSHEDKRRSELERVERTVAALEHVIKLVTGELRSAIGAVRDGWLTELGDEQLPAAREALASATDAWTARAADLDERYALWRWLSAMPGGKGYLSTRRRLVALSGPNGEPTETEVVEAAMRQLAEPPSAPPEPVEHLALHEQRRAAGVAIVET